MTMPELEPMNRTEALLAGEDLEPTNRLEYFLKEAGSGGGGGCFSPLFIGRETTAPYTAPDGVTTLEDMLAGDDWSYNILVSVMGTTMPVASYLAYNETETPFPVLKKDMHPGIQYESVGAIVDETGTEDAAPFSPVDEDPSGQKYGLTVTKGFTSNWMYYRSGMTESIIVPSDVDLKWIKTDGK